MIRHYFKAALIVCSLTIASRAFAQPLRPPELPAPDSAAQTMPGQPGGAEPGYLGLLADDRGEQNAGARLKEVVPDSPAEKAGLKPGDLLTSVNGKPIHAMDDMITVLQALPAGAKVNFEIQRGDQSETVAVTLGQRPPPDQRKFQSFGRLPDAPPEGSGDQSLPGQPADTQSPMPARNYGSQPGLPSVPPPPLLGVRTLDVTEQDRARLGLQSTAGAHVVARTRGSAAERANIPLDAVIVAVNGQSVENSTSLSSLLSRAGAGATVELTYLYNGKPVRAQVTLGAMASGNAVPPSRSSRPANIPPQGNVPGDMSRPQNPGELVPSSPSHNYQLTPPTDAQRIEALERRVHELEQRIQELEDRLQRRT